MTFKPYPWLTFFTILVFAALITLGVWQVQRYEWKVQLNADIENYSKLEPVVLTTLLDDAPTENHKYRSVKLTGKYLPENQILVRGQYKKSERVILYGFYVYNTFQYTHNGADRQIMVERGFITENSYNAPETYNKLPEDEVTILGNIKAAENPGSFMPDNAVETGTWFWRDIVAMTQKFKFENADDFYISTSGAGYQDFPKPTKLEIKSAVNHLSYLITWFALAAGLLILYIYMHVYAGRLYLNKNKPQENETSS